MDPREELRASLLAEKAGATAELHALRQRKPATAAQAAAIPGQTYDLTRRIGRAEAALERLGKDETAARDAEKAKAKSYADSTSEMRQFQALAPDQFPDLTQGELEHAAEALAGGMKAEAVFGQIEKRRNNARIAAKEAESMALRKRADARAQEKHEAFKASIPAREARAKAAAERWDRVAFEPYINDAEQDLRRMEARLKEVRDAGEPDPAKVAAAIEARDAAEAHVYRMRAMRPGDNSPSDVAGSAERVSKAAGGMFGGSAASYPSWLVDTPEARKAWDAASEDEKKAQIAKRGR